MPTTADQRTTAPLAQGRRGWRIPLLSAAVIALSFLAFSASPASAGTLANPSWAVSNNQVGATAVSYSYSFTAATTGTIKSITFVVSGAGLAGTPTITRNFGVGAGTVAIVGQTITYTVTAAISVPAGTPIYLEFGALTNSATPGAYTTAITTKTAVAATIDTVSPGPTITLAASNTAVVVSIAKSLTFTVNTAAFELDLDPSLPALADQSATVGLTVQTNAHSGYTLTVADAATGMQGALTGNPVIAKVSANKAGSVTWPGASSWGYTVTGTGATIDPAFSASKYAGYTTAGEQIASRATATGGVADTINIASRLAIDYSTAAGVYSDTLTYTVTPNYA